MSASRLYVVSDEDDDSLDASDSELELVDYDSEPEIVEVITRETSSAGAAKQKSSTTQFQNGPIQLPDSGLQQYRLGSGCVIKPGDTVELKRHSMHDGDGMNSGDFLRVKHIIINLETDEIRFRGHRLRRTKYLDQIFDWKLNELSMVLRVDESDPRCPFVAGMEDIPIDEVLRPRECVLTNRSYPRLSFRDGPRCAYPASFSDKEIKHQVFHGGRLACRVVNILINKNKAKPHAGIIRHLYAIEADSPKQGPGTSRAESIALDDDDHDEGFIIVDSDNDTRSSNSGAHSNSAEHASTRHQPQMPAQNRRYIFGDVFCGAGGASQGARQAGLQVMWGLDNDDDAIKAYQSNYPGALPFRCNAHNFPPRGHSNEELNVDILHLSPPCCFFSPAHTREGPNDQANLEAIYTVGPILDKVKPRVATLEQTSGLSTFAQHKANFLMLLHDIGRAGYDVRYVNQDLSEFGLVQKRKRLLIIAARRGTPLPPFPKATHGEPGSGLKPWHFINDALIPIQRLAFRPTDDQYHQPKQAKEPKSPYSPHNFLKSCITTSGPTEYHYSGTRRYTARELSLFQSFPIDYKFHGSQGQAVKQIGNAFPPIVAEALYRTIAKTLEAFDQGYIDAEDDLDLCDLDELLKRKGVTLQPPPSVPRALFDLPARPSRMKSRHLVRNDRSPTITSSSSSFAQRRASRPQQSRERSGTASQPINLLDGFFDGMNDEGDDDVRENIESRIRRPARIIENSSREIIEISSESESESDGDSD